MNTRTTARLAVLATVAVLLTACGAQPGSTGTDQSASLDTVTEQVATTEGSLGTFLVDDEGRTLYVFTQDSPGRSACHHDCLETWPPVEGEVTAGSGVDAALLGATEREDGTVQATYADRPLYYYAQDSTAGDVKGQGADDAWFVVDASGATIEKAAPAENRGGGYSY